MSKSKRTARAASFGGLPRHPALNNPDPLLAYRLGSDEPLRLPDSENAPTAATVLRAEYTVGSDAAGAAVWAENHALSASKLTWVVTAGSTGVFTGTAHPQNTSFAAEARAARCVAMRVKITYIGVEQEAAGYLSFNERVNYLDVDNTALDLLHTGAAAQVRATEGMLVHIDYFQLPRFEALGSSFMLNTMPCAVFTASGLPASKASLFRVRVERFMEYLPAEGSLAEGELRHEPHNPAALAAHGELSGNNTSIATATGAAVLWTRVKQVANAAYHMAQPVMPYVVAKARQQLMAAATSAAPLLLTL